MKKTIKKFIVTSIDQSDTANCLPEVQCSFDTREDAVAWIKSDMEGYCDQYTYVDDETGKTVGPMTYDDENFFIESAGGESSCQWNVCEHDLEVEV